jgi:hypothetical protein
MRTLTGYTSRSDANSLATVIMRRASAASGPPAGPAGSTYWGREGRRRCARASGSPGACSTCVSREIPPPPHAHTHSISRILSPSPTLTNTRVNPPIPPPLSHSLPHSYARSSYLFVFLSLSRVLLSSSQGTAFPHIFLPDLTAAPPRQCGSRRVTVVEFLS